MHVHEERRGAGGSGGGIAGLRPGWEEAKRAEGRASGRRAEGRERKVWDGTIDRVALVASGSKKSRRAESGAVGR